MRNMTFSKVVMTFLFFTVILNLLNGFTVKSPFLYSLILASLGIFLLLKPVYPESLEQNYDAATCKKIIRAAAIVEILISFLIKTSF